MDARVFVFFKEERKKGGSSEWVVTVCLLGDNLSRVSPFFGWAELFISYFWGKS